MDTSIEQQLLNLSSRIDGLESQLSDIDDRLEGIELVVSQDEELNPDEEIEFVSMLTPAPIITEEDQIIINDVSSSIFHGSLTLFAVAFIVNFSFNLLFKRLIK